MSSLAYAHAMYCSFNLQIRASKAATIRSGQNVQQLSVHTHVLRCNSPGRGAQLPDYSYLSQQGPAAWAVSGVEEKWHDYVVIAEAPIWRYYLHLLRSQSQQLVQYREYQARPAKSATKPLSLTLIMPAKPAVWDALYKILRLDTRHRTSFLPAP